MRAPLPGAIGYPAAMGANRNDERKDIMAVQDWSYDDVTASALRTITAIATEARAAEGQQAEPRWAMAYGVLRCWSELVGDAARTEDRAMLEQLFEGMPVPPEEEPGGWHFTSVLVLPRR
jgi:hypothetical protein